MRYLLPCLLCLVVSTSRLVAAEDGWHRGAEGVAIEEILTDWPLREPAEPVVVAVLDSGFDIDHPRLAPVLWRNPEEVDGEEGVDDDGNGFVDDRHGWSFLQSSDGEDLIGARMEVTRLFDQYQAEVDAGERAEDDPEYREVARRFRSEQLQWFGRLQRAYMAVAIRDQARTDIEAAGLDPDALDEIDESQIGDWRARIAVRMLRDMRQGRARGMFRMFRMAETNLEYGYNPDFDESAVLGDDPEDPAPTGYGGPSLSVDWRDAHGTMVAGTVAATGAADDPHTGLCPWARILAVRSTPDGDERDKDVANGIRYAVANGARIINMSFGKPYSPQKHWVDAAMREAEAAGVLVVAAAGNDGADIAEEVHYPSRFVTAEDGSVSTFANWLVVGACGPRGRIARFSNYGDEEVDLVAPGVDVAAITADGGTDRADGTSLAAPVASGVAALLWSQFPEATVEQIRIAMIAGARPVEGRMPRPGGGGNAGLSELVITGGALDARYALATLARMMGDESIVPEAWRARVAEQGADAAEPALP